MKYVNSRYNVTFDYNNGKYIFNTASGALAIINDEIIQKLYNKASNVPFSINEEPYSSLYAGGFLIPNDIDELSEIKCRLNESKYRTTNQEYLICLSYECNLTCPYCFERNWVKKTSSSMTDDSILKFLRSKASDSDTKSIRVNWSGGEPLLFIGRIAVINKAISNSCENNRVKYRSKLTTNLTIGSSDLPEHIHGAGIHEIQVTLDGHKAVHDKYRVSSNYPETYDLILSNVVQICDSISSLKIVIRVNISKESLLGVTDIINDLERLGLKNQVRIAFSRLRGMVSNSFTIEEYSKHEIALYRLLHKTGWNVNLKRKLLPRGVGCGAYTKRSYAISPDLKVLKCWELGSTDKHVVGRIENDGSLHLNRKECIALALDPFDNIMCKQCLCLPLCMGGCAVDRAKTSCVEKSDMKLGRNCNPIKYNLLDILKLTIDANAKLENANTE